MSEKQLRIQRLRPEATIPRYQTPHSAGMDLHACLNEPIVLEPGHRALVPTGLALAIPEGFEGQVRARSGLALRQGLALVNAPGTIDADYRGELGVLLINLGQEPLRIAHAERIAQLVIAPVIQPRILECNSLEATLRGQGGFGHTGV